MWAFETNPGIFLSIGSKLSNFYDRILRGSTNFRRSQKIKFSFMAVGFEDPGLLPRKKGLCNK